MASSVHRYNREEMFALRETAMSRKRPSNLSTDFDNENGYFSPDKWLEHRWRCEGVENRVGGRRKPAPGSRAAEVATSEDASVLSPQRRGFASGCRASSPKTSDPDGQSKSAWRQGRAVNGTDFKPAFQKSALESKSKDNSTNSSGWRGPNGEVHKPWSSKSGSRHTTSSDRERSMSHTDEKMPEWLDEGPVSHTDVIELKGFDEDMVAKKPKKKQKGQREQVRAQSSVSTEGTARDKEQSGSNSQQGSRPPSSPMNPLDQARAPSGNGSITSALPDGLTKLLPERTISPKGLALLEGLGAMPNSDAEFAKIMGLLDSADPGTDAQASIPAAQQPSSSRLSRFFSRSAAAASADTNNNAGQVGPRPIMGQSSKQVENQSSTNAGDGAGPNLLQKLFASAGVAKTSVPTNTVESTGRPMRLEDLERDIASKHAGSSQQKLYDDRNHRDPMLTAKQQTLLNLLNSRQQLQRPSPPAQPTSRVSPIPTSASGLPPGFPPHIAASLANLARQPNAGPSGMMPSPLMRPDANAVNNILLQARLQQNALMQTIQARLLQSYPELFQNPNALRAAINQIMQNAALANALGAPSGLPPNLPPMTLPPPNIAVPTSHAPEAQSAASSAASSGRQIPNTSYMPTSVMRQMTKTPSRQQNSSGSQSASTTPVNLPPHLHNLGESLASGLQNDRNSPPEHVSPPRNDGSSPTPSGATKQNKPFPLGMPEVSPYSPQGYAAAAAMVGANPGIAQMSPWRFPVQPMALAQFTADQQQLAMAVQRGDLAAAEAIRARIITQVQALASMPPYSPFVAPPGVGMPGMPLPTDQRDLPSPPSSTNMPSPMKLPDILAHTRAADVQAAVAAMPASSALDHILSSHNSNATLASIANARPSGPAILNRLPPTAKPITVEDLEREIAGMKATSSR
ncbi:CBN-PQN-45 protein [Aphelenchoides avenae]|nr:CBN-PQN-45 protein [Aphelenchus avenae]